MEQLVFPWWAQLDEGVWKDDEPLQRIDKKNVTLYAVEKVACNGIEAQASLWRMVGQRRTVSARLSTLENELLAADRYLCVARDKNGNPAFPFLNSEYERACWLEDYLKGEITGRQIMAILEGISNRMEVLDALGISMPLPLPMLPLVAKARVRRAA